MLAWVLNLNFAGGGVPAKLADGVTTSGTSVATGTNGTAMPGINIGQVLDILICAQTSSALSDTPPTDNTSGAIAYYHNSTFDQHSTNGYIFERWYGVVTEASASPVISSTWSGTANLSIAVAILNGVTIANAFTSTSTNQNSQTGISGANAQTSGTLVGALPYPAILCGWGFNTGENGAPTAGTGFTAIGNVWTGLGSACLTYETAPANRGTDPAATFTPFNTSRVYTFAQAYNLAGVDSPVAQRSGPGISPDSRLQFSTFAYDTTYLGATVVQGTAFIGEGADGVVGVGSLTNIASAAIVEGPDGVGGAATLLNEASAAIVEGPDGVNAQVLISGIICSAAIVEGPDGANATGALSVTANAAIVEGADGPVGHGLTSVSAAAAIVEGPDGLKAPGLLINVASADIIENSDGVVGVGGYAAIVCSAAIVEGPDGISTSALAAIVARAAIVEGPDTVQVPANLLNIASAAIVEGYDYLNLLNVASANIYEGWDAILAFASNLPQRFGWANIVALTQAPNGIQGAQSAYLENSSCVISASFFALTGTAFTPSSVQYRVDDMRSGQNLVPWTPLQPAEVNMIFITSAQNALVSYTRDSETHQVLLQIVDDFGDVNYARVLFDLLRVPGLAQPDLNIAYANIYEGPDLVTGGN